MRISPAYRHALPPGARAEWGSLPGSSTGMRWSTTFSGAGELGVKALALLDTANTTAYGTPRITTVSTAACTRPGILVTGHDLKDLADLLESRPRGLGWTPTPTARCCRRTPTPVLRSNHLVGNYGGSWPFQREESER